MCLTMRFNQISIHFCHFCKTNDFSVLVLISIDIVGFNGGYSDNVPGIFLSYFEVFNIKEIEL